MIISQYNFISLCACSHFNTYWFCFYCNRQGSPKSQNGAFR